MDAAITLLTARFNCLVAEVYAARSAGSFGIVNPQQKQQHRQHQHQTLAKSVSSATAAAAMTDYISTPHVQQGLIQHLGSITSQILDAAAITESSPSVAAAQLPPKIRARYTREQYCPPCIRVLALEAQVIYAYVAAGEVSKPHSEHSAAKRVTAEPTPLRNSIQAILLKWPWKDPYIRGSSVDSVRVAQMPPFTLEAAIDALHQRLLQNASQGYRRPADKINEYHIVAQLFGLEPCSHFSEHASNTDSRTRAHNHDGVDGERVQKVNRHGSGGVDEASATESSIRRISLSFIYLCSSALLEEAAAPGRDGDIDSSVLKLAIVLESMSNSPTISDENRARCLYLLRQCTELVSARMLNADTEQDRAAIIMKDAHLYVSTGYAPGLYNCSWKLAHMVLCRPYAVDLDGSRSNLDAHVLPFCQESLEILLSFDEAAPKPRRYRACDVYSLLGRIHFRCGRYSLAIEYFAQCLEDGSVKDHASVVYLTAVQYVFCGAFEDACELLMSLLHLVSCASASSATVSGKLPTASNIIYWLARISLYRGEWECAQRRYAEILAPVFGDNERRSGVGHSAGNDITCVPILCVLREYMFVLAKVVWVRMQKSHLQSDDGLHAFVERALHMCDASLNFCMYDPVLLLFRAELCLYVAHFVGSSDHGLDPPLKDSHGRDSDGAFMMGFEFVERSRASMHIACIVLDALGIWKQIEFRMPVTSIEGTLRSRREFFAPKHNSNTTSAAELLTSGVIDELLSGPASRLWLVDPYSCQLLKLLLSNNVTLVNSFFSREDVSDIGQLQVVELDRNRPDVYLFELSCMNQVSRLWRAGLLTQAVQLWTDHVPASFVNQIRQGDGRNGDHMYLRPCGERIVCLTFDLEAMAKRLAAQDMLDFDTKLRSQRSMDQRR